MSEAVNTESKAKGLSSKIEDLQRRWRTEQWENDRPYNPIGAAGVCADELTPLLERAREMEREDAAFGNYILNSLKRVTYQEVIA